MLIQNFRCAIKTTKQIFKSAWINDSGTFFFKVNLLKKAIPGFNDMQYVVMIYLFAVLAGP
ncbi:hypothetical protein SAMN05216524_103133 [Mucilaginibacter sp. OK098]|nr:hypothetical protein SAMN05216524_103133 [Mucilaginibacter sp. OK098]